MQVARNSRELHEMLGKLKAQSSRVGLVPTMGALHKGHITLVKQSVLENEGTVVSIFVNPTQFNNSDDLKRYPRNLGRDLNLLEQVGCDLVFAPQEEDMYSAKEVHSRFEFDFQGLDQVMEGKFRPGHFHGVVQIVSKLFSLIQPHRAYFGEKDFQQLAIIRYMTKKMGFDTQIIPCEIIREPSGLAMSSRNERLTPEQRKIAANISRILFECRTFVPEYSPAQIEQWIENEIAHIRGLTLEYIEIVNTHTLHSATGWSESTVACIAVYCGDVRLIDNIRCS